MMSIKPLPFGVPVRYARRDVPLAMRVKPKYSLCGQ